MSPRRPSKRLVEASERIAELDPVMRTMLERIGPCDLRRGRPRREHFAELARAITYQQLAGRAASAIHGRFVLRGAGLSGSKTASIRDLADKVVDGSVQLDRIARLPDDEIERELTLVRGIGPWTAHMFLIFQLGRLDVWPVDDYGVRSGYARLYGLGDVPKARELAPLGDRFRPYRSVAAWYCWRAADTVTPGDE
jgi:DNA-3-methyladenine glycosylase II